MGVADTFCEITEGWSVKALNVQAVPPDIRQTVVSGIPARVPGEVTLDLLREGLIDEPFEKDNESVQQWIGDVDWQYECHFDWSDDGNQRHDLVAYGLDTVCSVMLNGRLVGNAQNYHCEYRWDVNGLIHEGSNALTITFSSSVRQTEVREQRLGRYPHTEHHAFNQLRKPAYQFGWDWGIDVVNAGIWQAIGIDSWSEVRFDRVCPLVDVTSDGNGILRTDIAIERSQISSTSGQRVNAGDIDGSRLVHDDGIEVIVRLSGNGVDLVGKGTINPQRVTTRVELVVPAVQLWWPSGYGDHPLYRVSVCVRSGGVECSRWSGNVGFRRIRVDTRADDTGRPFQLYVNDVPIHARGYNWVPLDAFVTRRSRERYRLRFDDLVASNSNMVRVWGGGIYESDDFYDLADENGIMVWQDFAFACASYSEDPDTKMEVEQEARQQIIRLSPHPSLVVYNGSNENYIAYEQWDGVKQELRDDDRPANEYGYGEKGWGDYYYSRLLPALLEELDPTRVYLPSSPMSFSKFVDANKDTDGTMHIWDVWNQVDYRHYADYLPRFADEFGYQAPPAWSTMISMVGGGDGLDPFSKQMLAHQKADGGNIKLARGMRSHLTPGLTDSVSYRTDGSRDWLIKSDRWTDVEDWHWACQLQQAQAIRFGVEYMRSLEPLNAGTLIWQLNDDWPVISWSAVDYDGHRKPLWYVSRQCFAPRFASLQPTSSSKIVEDCSWEGTRVPKDQLVLALSNDTMQPWEGYWMIERQSLTGDVLATQHVHVTLGPLDHRAIRVSDEVAGWTNKSNEIIVATPSSLQSLLATDQQDFARVILNGSEVVEQALDPRPLKAIVKPVCGGYALQLQARSFARDVFCMVDKLDSQASIDDGMVTLLPGESVTWNIRSVGMLNPSAFTQPNILRCANDLKR